MGQEMSSLRDSITVFCEIVLFGAFYRRKMNKNIYNLKEGEKNNNIVGHILRYSSFRTG